MLIQSSFCTLQNGALRLRAWNRAPLNLSEGTWLYMLAVAGTPHLPLPQLIISPFSPESWRDLWRLDLDVKERLGLMAELFDVLAANKIKVLAAESTALDSGSLHTISLVLDCTGYSSLRDGSCIERFARNRPVLLDLYANIAVTFAGDLVFWDGELPRLGLRRMLGHHECAERAHRGESLDSTSHWPARVKKGRILLPRSLTSALGFGRVRVSTIRAMVLSDSKERLIRAVFCRADCGVVHARIFIRNCAATAPTILNRIAQANFTVLRSQVRQGVFGRSNIRNPGSFDTMDLLLRSMSPSPASDGTLQKLIRRRLVLDPDLSDAGIQVQYPVGDGGEDEQRTAR